VQGAAGVVSNRFPRHALARHLRHDDSRSGGRAGNAGPACPEQISWPGDCGGPGRSRLLKHSAPHLPLLLATSLGFGGLCPQAAGDAGGPGHPLPMDAPRAVLSWKLFQNVEQVAVLRLSRPHVAVISSPPFERTGPRGSTHTAFAPARSRARGPAADWHAGREGSGSGRDRTLLVLDTSEPLQRESEQAAAAVWPSTRCAEAGSGFWQANDWDASKARPNRAAA